MGVCLRGVGVTVNRRRLRKVQLRRECLSRDLKEVQPGRLRK